MKNILSVNFDDVNPYLFPVIIHTIIQSNRPANASAIPVYFNPPNLNPKITEPTNTASYKNSWSKNVLESPLAKEMYAAGCVIALVAKLRTANCAIGTAPANFDVVKTMIRTGRNIINATIIGDNSRDVTCI